MHFKLKVVERLVAVDHLIVTKRAINYVSNYLAMSAHYYNLYSYDFTNKI
jgi:hypothetical protein